MSVPNLGRLMRTVGHLRMSQVMWRARYAVEHAVQKRSSNRLTAAADLSLREDVPVPDVMKDVGASSKVLSQLGRGSLTLLNRELSLGQLGCFDWKPDSVSPLSIINLHYHEWLLPVVAQAASGDDECCHLFRTIINDWIDNCSLAQCHQNRMAWNSFAIATRVGSWIQSLWRLGDRLKAVDPKTLDKMVYSLREQLCHLASHIEWDLRGNHVLRDAVGLAWGSRAFCGRESDRWSQLAADIARSQVQEQILEDGGHFERSPMYHCHVMDDILLLYSLLEDVETRRVLREAWSRAAEFLARVIDTDGQLPLLNDAARAPEHSPVSVIQGGQRFGIPSPSLSSGARYFPDTGLALWRGVNWSCTYDVAAVGPDYQPGHAHADTLSVLCSYQGTPVFIDTGTFDYENSARRQYERSTAAHNTVELDGECSSEVWGVFRVGRRAKVHNVDFRGRKQGFECSACHDGYRHLAGKPVHTRSVQVADTDGLTIEDQLAGSGSHSVSGGYLLNPGWHATEHDHGWMLRHDSGTRLFVGIKSNVMIHKSVEERPSYPEYGIEVPTTRLCWSYQGQFPARIETRVSGSPVKE